MQYWIYEDDGSVGLRPLTLTRPCWELRIGIDTVFEKWTRYLGQKPLRYAVGHLAAKFGETPDPKADSLGINSRVLPDKNLLKALQALRTGEGLLDVETQTLIGFRGGLKAWVSPNTYITPHTLRHDIKPVAYTRGGEAPDILQAPADLFRLNGKILRRDFEELTRGKTAMPITDPHTRVYKPEAVYIAPGAKLRATLLDAEAGPIYIGASAELQPGSLVQGAHAICNNAVVGMGAKLRGDSTIGPWCKVGGEIGNSNLQGFSNKAHDGYLGNSVIGQWCNLGADTNVSNLKNNYSTVRVYDYATEEERDTGLQFHGLVMGDHSKAGINTMFNTGTVVGVMANVWGGGFPPKHIPSFAWLPADDEPATFDFQKAIDLAATVMARRKVAFTEADADLLEAVYNATQHHRWWESPSDALKW